MTPPLLHIVTGKGGAGKTTIAAALGLTLARGGRRVLVCEVEGRGALATLFGVQDAEGPVEQQLFRLSDGGRLNGLSVDAHDALEEYLNTFYKLGMAGRALDRFGVLDFATSIAPGLRDVLLTGKVYEAVRRRIKGRPNSYDAVVLDAPPTGRIARFLNVHEAVSDLAKVGPIHAQADSILDLFRSEHTVVHLVSLLQEMPVTETLEAIAELAPTGIRAASIIANRVSPAPLSADDFAILDRGGWSLDVPGLDRAQTTALTADFADAVLGLRSEQECYEQLLAADLPLVEIPADPDGIDESALLEIAGLLRAQLPGVVT